MTEPIFPQPTPQSGRTKRRWAVPAGVILIVAVVLASLWVCRRLPSTRRADCLGQLEFVGAGMQNHLSFRGCYPPAYVAGRQGRPMHSWRVLLLSQMEQRGTYKQYDFDEPWNGPHNRRLAHGAPPGTTIHSHAYRCPADHEAGEWDTSYVKVVGPGTISDGPTATKSQDITDGAAHTIAVAETSSSGIHWMEPRDLDFDEMSFKVNDPTGMSIRSHHPGVVNVMFADGSVQSISENIDPEVLKGLFTIAGGEEFPDLNP